MPTTHRPNPSSVFRAAVAANLLAAACAHAGTLAYYRFEGGAPGAEVLRPQADESGNGRELGYWGRSTYSAEVPISRLPGSGATNQASVRFDGDADLFSPADEGLSRVTPNNFTIETWVKFSSLEGIQTFIGRDDQAEGAGRQALFYLSKSGNIGAPPDQTPNGLRVELITRDNHVLMVNSSHVVELGKWYHVAAVGDAAAGTLSLFVDGQLAGRTHGFTGLFSPTRFGMWSLGRGQFNEKPTDRFKGHLDEVRFSDEALPPELLLCTGSASAATNAGQPLSEAEETLRQMQTVVLHIARNGDETMLSWEPPAAPLRAFEIFRNTNDQLRGRLRIALTRADRQPFHDKLPGATEPFWYWLKLTSYDGQVVNIGPIPTPAPDVWTP